MEKKLTIAMVIDSYDNSKNGTVISTKRFAEALRAQGHTVKFLTTGAPEPGKVCFPEMKIPFANGMIQKMKAPLAKPIRAKIKETLKDVDVIHIHYPFFLGHRVAKMAQEMEIPMVATFHIQAEHVLKNIGLNNRVSIYLVYQLFLNSIYNKAQRVICPSQFAKEELQRFGLKSPAVVISNGVPALFQPQDVERPAKWADKFLLVTVGRLAKEKQQHLLFEAVRQSKYAKDIQILIFGEGPREDFLKHKAKSLPNPPIFDSVSAQELVYFNNLADLYVHTAEIEVECMSVMEAMACGAPLLISNSDKSAAGQFALDERSLFERGSVDDLTHKIEYWMEHRDELQEAKTQYTNHALNYTHARSVEKLLETYYSVLPIPA